MKKRIGGIALSLFVAVVMVTGAVAANSSDLYVELKGDFAKKTESNKNNQNDGVKRSIQGTSSNDVAREQLEKLQTITKEGETAGGFNDMQ